MIKPTQAHSKSIQNNKKEPTIRMGRKVPKNAVNLGYYFNPTASESERVLTSEAPRNIIDHRIEEAYRYLFRQASNDNSLFPGSIEFKDQEGYQGRLGRVYVEWYANAHTETKNVKDSKRYLGLLDKGNVPKMVTWEKDGFSGSLYLDNTDYEVSEYKEVQTQIPLDYTVKAHELSYSDIFPGKFIDASELESWLIEPGKSGSRWCNSIIVNDFSLKADGGITGIQNYVNQKSNPYIDVNGPAVGILTFKNIDFEPVKWEGSTPGQTLVNDQLVGSVYNETTDEDDDAITNIDDMFPPSFQTYYDWDDASYDDKEITNFEDLMNQYESGTNNVDVIDDYTGNGRYQITVYRTYHKTEEEEYETGGSSPEDPVETHTRYKFSANYSATVTKRGNDAKPKYNVTCNYGGTLITSAVFKTMVPYRYNVTAEYVGIVRKVWYDYDGVAYYRGSVTKGSAIGNMNPMGNDELLMFPDENGFLRTKDGQYEIEADVVYLTDVFKDNTPCFYKYKLKNDLYDYRGPDSNGFYDGTAVQMTTSLLKEIPDSYKYAIKLKVSAVEDEEYVSEDYQVAHRQIPTRYSAYLYTSFISGAKDTFKCVYNGFDNVKKDNVALNNGIIEEVFNYPFYENEKDYKMIVSDKRARLNKIQLINPNVIEDSRKYVTFSYKVKAVNKDTGEVIYSDERTVSILNLEYALKEELYKFRERSMIISPIVDDITLSPMDIILNDQANRKEIAPVITSKSNAMFTVIITQIQENLKGAVNTTCNPNGSGVLLAETTEDTGFFDDVTGTYTKKVSLENKYLLENGKIFFGYQVKCIDARKIKISPPRENGLLDSWLPVIQFGHYSQVLDQYGAHMKVVYSMPEYDTQTFSETYKRPYVDVSGESVKILNSYTLKVNKFPLLVIQEENKYKTIKVFKKIENEIFPIEIENVSFSDGIILTKTAVSENDNIICDYVYLEENYVYRGFLRTKDDFCRIDLNPNIYHTYSDMTYVPAEDKQTKNLFNKVIYFFMKPTTVYEIIDKTDLVKEEVLTPESMEDLFEHDGRFSFNGTENFHANETEEDSWVYDKSVTSIKQPIVTTTFNGILSIKQFIKYEMTVKLMSSGSEKGDNGVIAAFVTDNGITRTLSIVAKKETNQIVISYNYNGKNAVNLFEHKNLTGGTTDTWNRDYIFVKIKKDGDKFYFWHSNWNSDVILDQYEMVDLNAYPWGLGMIGRVGYGYANKGQSESYFECTSFKGESETEKQYQVSNIKFENVDTIYHQIDDSAPKDDMDLYIGSAYIRQNTSLQSTVLIDTRKRGGGVIESMKDELRRKLEPESDWYLDIGYTDGKPYQENGVIVIKLENSILKEYGGRFTIEEVEERVKTWLGYGILPIIEYVNVDSKEQLPQTTIEITDSYSNITGEILEIYPEVIEE